LDAGWRRELVRAVGGAGRVLDVGCGTGETTRMFGKRAFGLDVSRGMLQTARRRGGAAGWVEARADRLPFRDGAFEAVVSAFVVRNLHLAGTLEPAIGECLRVLAPGGRLAFLDLTRPRRWIVRLGHRVYGRTVMPGIGRALFGDRWPGRYLADSIERLPPETELRRMCLAAGAVRWACRPLTGGIASLFLADK
jgi:demethylmenaquinone methyltransferase/2-methoxy-6-polyprenyl-1,4-benzoquinol methylase